MGWGNDDDYVQPKDPPKVIYHGPYASGKDVPEEFRRVFGTNPPPESKRPVPPPPLPPNSYHKKPKYWQTRGTGHMSTHNRIAGVMAVIIGGVMVAIHKLSNAPERWGNRVGYSMTPEQRREYEERNQFHWSLITNPLPPDQYEYVGITDRYRNPRKDDNLVRWDYREVDKRVMGIRDMANPFDDRL